MTVINVIIINGAVLVIRILLVYLQVATLVPLSTVAMEYCSLVRLFLPSVDKMIEQCSGYSSQMR